MSCHKFLCFAYGVVEVFFSRCVSARCYCFRFSNFCFEVCIRDKFAGCIEVIDRCLKCCISCARSGGSVHCVTSDNFYAVFRSAVIVCARSVVVDVKCIVNFDHVLLNYVFRRFLCSAGFNIYFAVFLLRECIDESLEVICEEYFICVLSAVSPSVPCRNDSIESICGRICGVCRESLGKESGYCFVFKDVCCRSIVKVVDYRLCCGDDLFLDLYFVRIFCNYCLRISFGSGCKIVKGALKSRIGSGDIFGEAVCLTERSVFGKAYGSNCCDFLSCLFEVCVEFFIESSIAGCGKSGSLCNFCFEVCIRDKFAICIEVINSILKSRECRACGRCAVHSITSDILDTGIGSCIIVCGRTVVVNVKSIGNSGHPLLNYVLRRFLCSAEFDIDRAVFLGRESRDKSLKRIGRKDFRGVISAVRPFVPCRNEVVESCCGGCRGISRKSLGKKSRDILILEFRERIGNVVKVSDYSIRSRDNIIFDLFFISLFALAYCCFVSLSRRGKFFNGSGKGGYGRINVFGKAVCLTDGSVLSKAYGSGVCNNILCSCKSIGECSIESGIAGSSDKGFILCDFRFEVCIGKKFAGSVQMVDGILKSRECSA